jgi:hypothetical protein
VESKEPSDADNEALWLTDELAELVNAPKSPEPEATTSVDV